MKELQQEHVYKKRKLHHLPPQPVALKEPKPMATQVGKAVLLQQVGCFRSRFCQQSHCRGGRRQCGPRVRMQAVPVQLQLLTVPVLLQPAPVVVRPVKGLLQAVARGLLQLYGAHGDAYGNLLRS